MLCKSPYFLAIRVLTANTYFQTLPSQGPIRNHWDEVDDFKWLKAEHSPNWSILPEGERITEDVWSKVVPGGPGVGLEDILKKIGIKRLLV